MLNREKITQFLKNPVADKVLGFIAISPAFYSLYLYWGLLVAGEADMYRSAIAVGSVILIVSIAIRRVAKRVSLNPLFWFITAARNYWAAIVINYIYIFPINNLLVPISITHTLFFIALGIIFYSRISLGRNLGLVPARRELVTTGAYSYVRHPIHTGELLFFLSFLLVGFSVLNWSLLLLGAAFVIWKSLIEENFLKDDADYREYCKKVPYRWIPGVI